MYKRLLAGVIFLNALALASCGSRIPISSAPPASTPAPNNAPVNARPVQVRDYQRLFDSVGDRCYPGDQFPTDIADTHSAEPVGSSRRGLNPVQSVDRSGPLASSFLSSGHYLATAFVQTTSQGTTSVKKRAVSSVDDLALLSDIELAKFKEGELVIIGPPAKEGEGFRPDDWYTVFRAIAGTEAPGVTIDPGPDSRVMQVRYFGGIQQTALGSTFFEADRTLKLLSTGYDNLTCAVWPGRPLTIATELDLISGEIGDGSRPLEGEGGWHRFWFEPSEESIETEGSAMRMPKNRLIVKDESVPPGRPSPSSARQFAFAISTNFLGMAERVQAFRNLQKDAALVILAKWMRDKQIPADEDWVRGMPAQESTATTTPSITVLRAKLLDQFYLRYGIHGGVDFQKDNRYGAVSPQSARLSAAVDQSAVSGAPNWRFTFDGRSYEAVRLLISSPVQIRPQWVIWQRVVTRVLVQPRTIRALVPVSNFVVTNRDTRPITLHMSGPVTKTEQIPPGPGPATVIRVVPGFYTLQISSASCGTKSDAVTVGEGERHELEFRCVVAPPQSVPVRTGSGSFVVNNNTGAPITISVGGMSYTAPPGTSTIRLAAGSYTATVTTRCGSASETLNMTDGMTYTGQYSCVPQ